MSLSEKLPIEDGQVHEGGTVNPESSHVVPVGDQYYPRHQGTKAPFKQDEYAEYLDVNGSWSLMSRSARRIKVDLQSCFTNDRRYHDWKGYDDIEPTGYTKVFFNDRQVGLVRGYANNILRHLVQVNDYIEEIQALGVFGWWSEEDLQNVVGKQVEYDGYPGVVVEVLDYIKNGQVVVYAPTWPDDGYDRGGRLRTPITHHKLNWYPDPDQESVAIPESVWG